MSIWDKFFKKPEKVKKYNWVDILSGIAPVYSNGFGTNIYASDVVQQAIYSIVTELKKLDPVHVRKTANDTDFVSVAGNIQNVLDNPNPLMTTTDFIEKIAWTLLLNYNAFIYPIWKGDTLVALYPLQPSQVDFQQDGTGKLWVVFTFPNGYEGEVAYDDIIHLRYRFSVSEFMGGNEYGQPDFKPLLDTLKLNDTLLKGLAKSLNLQTTINGIIKHKTMLNTDDQLKKVEEFERKLQSNENGFLSTDISSEYIPITKQIALLDATTLEFIDKKILRTFGVSIPIVNGDYTVEQYQAFYQKTLEPIVKSLGQAFTKGIFTKHAAQGFNNKIVFYAKELIFMSTAQKIDLFNLLVDSGSCYKNEMRVAFGLKPINDLQGQLAESSNKTNAENNKNGNSSDNGNSNVNNEDDNNDENGGVDNGGE